MYKIKKHLVRKKDSKIKASDSRKIEKSQKDLVPVLLKRHKDSQGNHHHIILGNIDDCHISVGTSSKAKKGKNSTNYKCENDIVGNGKDTYLRRQGTVDKRINYSNSSQGRMTPKDYAQAKIYGQRAKEKYLTQKKKK